MSERPKVEDAPGLVWRSTDDKWTAVWQARSDLLKRGFKPAAVTLWSGTEPSTDDAQEISFQCLRLQSEMLLWSRGGKATLNGIDGTLRSLINAYQTDSHSSYRKLRYHARMNHENLLKRIVAKHGDEMLAEIKGRLLIDWHKEWSGDNVKLSTGHLFASQLRTVFGFGSAILEDDECTRLCGVMSKLKFPMAKPREERLTAEQANAVRARAHYIGNHSIAMAQAFQFECTLRQKDVIGEWVPLEEPGTSDVIAPKLGKWLRGIRWEEIDASLMLRHTTSKKEKPIVVDLKLAPMVLEELEFYYGLNRIGPPNRDKLPDSGPVILSEYNALPYKASEFRRKWRIVAAAAGVPKDVWNMDTRSGAISEATDAGAPLEHVRHAAAHSQVSMTARYSRGSDDKIANVMQLRTEHRNKSKT